MHDGESGRWYPVCKHKNDLWIPPMVRIELQSPASDRRRDQIKRNTSATQMHGLLSDRFLKRFVGDRKRRQKQPEAVAPAKVAGSAKAEEQKTENGEAKVAETCNHPPDAPRGKEEVNSEENRENNPTSAYDS